MTISAGPGRPVYQSTLMVHSARMNNRPDGSYVTVTVRRSWPAATATGAAALVLDTVENGPIAFVVSPEVIQIIRKNLLEIEELLSRGKGTA
jgi:hypothetical protein